jgi:hypothetical protein
MRWLNLFVGVIAPVLLVGCGKSLPTPQETVGLYLKNNMGKDPMRVLPLLTDDFHRHHQMVFANIADLPDDTVFDASRKLLEEDPEYAAESGRMGWLMAPALIGMAHHLFPGLKEIELYWLGSEVLDDGAAVGLRALVAEDTPVDFTFRLKRRAETEPWRIDVVETVSDSSTHARLISYLITPNIETVKFIRNEMADRNSHVRSSHH